MLLKHLHRLNNFPECFNLSLVHHPQLPYQFFTFSVSHVLITCFQPVKVDSKMIGDADQDLVADADLLASFNSFFHVRYIGWADLQSFCKLILVQSGALSNQCNPFMKRHTYLSSCIKEFHTILLHIIMCIK